MLQSIITQNSASSQSTPVQVYEYALTVVNTQDKDTQKLTAAFTSTPSFQDWKQ